MSSARIAPMPRSPSRRSQPWPRSWNGKSGVGHRRRRAERLEAAGRRRREQIGEHVVERHLAELEPGLQLDARDGADEVDEVPLAAPVEEAKCPLDVRRRSACQRPRTRTAAPSRPRARRAPLRSASMSPIASFQSKRRERVGREQPARRLSGRTLVASRLTRSRLDERTQFRGSSTGTPSSSSRGIARAGRSRTSSPSSSTSVGSAASNAMPPSARGLDQPSWRARPSAGRRRGGTRRRVAAVPSSETGRMSVGSSAAWSHSSSTSSVSSSRPRARRAAG